MATKPCKECGNAAVALGLCQHHYDAQPHRRAARKLWKERNRDKMKGYIKRWMDAHNDLVRGYRRRCYENSSWPRMTLAEVMRLC